MIENVRIFDQVLVNVKGESAGWEPPAPSHLLNTYSTYETCSVLTAPAICSAPSSKIRCWDPARIPLVNVVPISKKLWLYVIDHV